MDIPVGWATLFLAVATTGLAVFAYSSARDSRDQLRLANDELKLAKDQLSAIHSQNQAIIEQSDTMQKQTRLQGLIHVHSMLANREARESRQKMFHAYFDCNKLQNQEDFKDFLKRAGTQIVNIRGDFDVIGSMFAAELVPRQAFLDSYAGIVIRCWTALAPTIFAERKEPGRKRFMEYFDKLNEASEDFWKSLGEGAEWPIPYDDRVSPP